MSFKWFGLTVMTQKIGPKEKLEGADTLCLVSGVKLNLKCGIGIKTKQGKRMSRRFDVKANREQERTGGKGTMADTEYDIHCPEMGGPTWKLNYLSDSCKLRKASGCKKCKKTKPKSLSKQT